MTIQLEEVSKITAKGQTTIPKSVRHVLGVDRGGRIAFVVHEQGVSIIRAEEDHEDPALAAFLDFLENDLSRRPQAITALSSSLAEQMAQWTQGVSVDLNEPIKGAVVL